MLVLSRRKDESVMIGDSLQVKVLEIQKNQVKLGIEAPRDVTVHRMEVYMAIQQENLAATQAADSDVSALTNLLKGASAAGPAADQAAKPQAKAKPKGRTGVGQKRAGK